MLPEDTPTPCNGDSPALLLVEDSMTVRDLLASFLRHSGYQVISCRSAENALKCIAQYTGDLQLLITDVVLEGKSGFELALELRGQWPKVPVLFVSGFPSGPATPPLENMIYLEKPFSLQTLTNAVRSLLPNGA